MKECENCHTSFGLPENPTAAQRHRFKTQRFCSLSCSSQWLRRHAPRVPVAERLWRRVEKTDTCWLWRGNISNVGYGTITVEGVTKYVHRVAYELAHGPIPEGLSVLHQCDVRACVNPEHLRVGSAQENAVEAASRGRRGSRAGHSKLTEEKVREIKELLRLGWKYTRISKLYGVTHGTIWHIALGKTWSHVE